MAKAEQANGANKPNSQGAQNAKPKNNNAPPKNDSGSQKFAETAKQAQEKKAQSSSPQNGSAPEQSKQNSGQPANSNSVNAKGAQQPDTAKSNATPGPAKSNSNPVAANNNQPATLPNNNTNPAVSNRNANPTADNKSNNTPDSKPQNNAQQSDGNSNSQAQSPNKPQDAKDDDRIRLGQTQTNQNADKAENQSQRSSDTQNKNDTQQLLRSYDNARNRIHESLDNGKLNQQSLQNAFGGKNVTESQVRDAISDQNRPSLQYAGNQQLKGNSGAYSSENGGTIFINENLTNNAQARENVITEELGHHIDNRVGGEDAQGDEGALFANEVLDRGLTEKQVESERKQNDSGEITVDGKNQDVEFSDQGNFRNLDEQQSLQRFGQMTSQLNNPESAQYSQGYAAGWLNSLNGISGAQSGKESEYLAALKLVTDSGRSLNQQNIQSAINNVNNASQQSQPEETGSSSTGSNEGVAGNQPQQSQEELDKRTPVGDYFIGGSGSMGSGRYGARRDNTVISNPEIVWNTHQDRIGLVRELGNGFKGGIYGEREIAYKITSIRDYQIYAPLEDKDGNHVTRRTDDGQTSYGWVNFTQTILPARPSDTEIRRGQHWNNIEGVSGHYGAYSSQYAARLADFSGSNSSIPNASVLQNIVNQVNNNVPQTTNTAAGDHQPAYYDSDNNGTVDYIRIQIGNTNNHAWYVSGDGAKDDTSFKRITTQAAIDAGVAERVPDTRQSADHGSTVTRPTSALTRITGNIPKEIEDTGDILTDTYTKGSLENDFKDSLRNLNDLLVAPELYLQTSNNYDSSTSATSSEMHKFVRRLNVGVEQLKKKSSTFLIAMAQAKERGYSEREIGLWVEQTLKDPAATSANQTITTNEQINALIEQKRDTYFNNASEKFDDIYRQFRTAGAREDAARDTAFINSMFGLLGGVAGSFAAIKGIVKSAASSAKSVANAREALKNTENSAAPGNLVKEISKARVARFDNVAGGIGLAVGDAYILNVAVAGFGTSQPVENNLSPSVAKEVAKVRSGLSNAQVNLHRRLKGFYIDNFDERFNRADVVNNTFQIRAVDRWGTGRQSSSGYSNKYLNYASKRTPDGHDSKIRSNMEVASARNRDEIAINSDYRYVVVNARYLKNPTQPASNLNPTNFVTYVARTHKDALILNHEGHPSDLVVGNNVDLFKGVSPWAFTYSWGDKGREHTEGRVMFQALRGMPANITPLYYGPDATRPPPDHRFPGAWSLGRNIGGHGLSRL